MQLVNNLKKTALPTGLFVLLSLPQVYGRTNNMLGANGADCPEYKTRILHTVSFFVLTYLSAKFYGQPMSKKQMLRCSLVGALMFFFLSSTELYSVTGSLVGRVNNNLGQRMGPETCPTLVGVAVHAIVFNLVLNWVMSLKD